MVYTYLLVYLWVSIATVKLLYYVYVFIAPAWYSSCHLVHGRVGMIAVIPETQNVSQFMPYYVLPTAGP